VGRRGEILEAATLLHNDALPSRRANQRNRISKSRWVVSRVSKDYDEAGKLKDLRCRDNSGPETGSLYRYDAAGRLIRLVSIDQNGVQSDSTIFSYDAAGRKTAQYFLSIDAGAGAMSFSHGLGESDQTAETLWYDRNHRFLRRVTYTRDTNGKLLKEEMHLDDDAFGFGEIANSSTGEREQLMAHLTKLLGADRDGDDFVSI
jgi:hypothetical protein